MVRSFSLLGSALALAGLIHGNVAAQAAASSAAPAPAPAAQAPAGDAGAKASTTASSNADAKATSNADAKSGAKLSAKDKKFMTDAASSGLAEVEASKLALTQSTNEETKKFAQKMIDDHTKANEELKALATSKNVELPAEPTGKHKAMVEKLKAAKGEEFDRLYTKEAGVKSHTEADKLFQTAAKQAKDPEVKAFFAKTQPTVHEHLTTVKDMAGSPHGKADKK